MSNFTDIGLKFDSEEEFYEFIDSQIPKAKTYFPSIPKKPVVLYEIEFGPGRIFAVMEKKGDEKEELVCFNPGFLGKIFRKFSVSSVYNEDCDYCFIFEGGMEPQEPVVFSFDEKDLSQLSDKAKSELEEFKATPPAVGVHFLGINYLAVCEESLKEGDIIDVNIVGFAHFLQKIAPEKKIHGYFLQTRMVKDEKEIPPEFYGICGELKKIEKLENPLTHNDFFYLVLYQEIVGDIEVVASPELVKEDLKKGDIVFAECWLEGMIRK